MKSHLLILLVIFTSIQSYSQSRVNREKLSFTNSSELFTNATGWAYNPMIGEWVDYENVISADTSFKNEFKTLQGPYMMSRLHQQFFDIQTKSLDFQGSQFYVLLIRKMDGKYEYPTIEEDWYYWEETHGFIFSEEEYQKLYQIEDSNIGDTVLLRTKTLVEMGSKYEEYDENIFIKKIQDELNSEYRGFDTYTFPVLKTTSDSSEVIRFYTPTELYEYFGSKILDLNDAYFETTLSEFNRLILYDKLNE